MAEGITRDRALLGAGVGICRWRLTPPITQAQLGNRAGVHPRRIGELENGVLNPRFLTLLRIADALEVDSLDELLGVLPLDELRRPED
jgi:transcriptional regulator with XRE-family HTH domain